MMWTLIAPATRLVLAGLFICGFVGRSGFAPSDPLDSRGGVESHLFCRALMSLSKAACCSGLVR